MTKFTVVDAHACLGAWNDQPDQFISADELVDSMAGHDQVHVEKALVSNLSAYHTVDDETGSQPLASETQANFELQQMCEHHPMLCPLAVCQPGWGSAEELEELLKQHKFYGLLFHPFFLNLPADSLVYHSYVRLAQKYQIPCVFHTGPGHAEPEVIYSLAQNYPDIPFVLYYMNLDGNDGNAIDVVAEAVSQRKANLYLETSQAPESHIIEAMQALGGERLLFGSEAPLGEMGIRQDYFDRVRHLHQVLSERFSDNDVEQFFAGTCRRLFGLDEQDRQRANSR